jgi:phage shock protein PspC (stress-responsive transcriptional regulator)
MKRLYRSTTDRKIAGVFGGLGEIFDIDPSLLRLLAVFVGLITGVVPMIITYLLAVWIIPKGAPGAGAK